MSTTLTTFVVEYACGHQTTLANTSDPTETCPKQGCNAPMGAAWGRE